LTALIASETKSGQPGLVLAGRSHMGEKEMDLSKLGKQEITDLIDSVRTIDGNHRRLKEATILEYLQRGEILMQDIFPGLEQTPELCRAR